MLFQKVDGVSSNPYLKNNKESLILTVLHLKSANFLSFHKVISISNKS